MSLPLLKKKNP